MKEIKILFTLIAFTLAFSFGANAQNLQSVKNRAHSNLLAKQTTIQDQIKAEQTQKLVEELYDEEEPEPDIYEEGWESGLVNPFNKADVPNRKDIDVTGYVMPLKNYRVSSNYGYRPRFRRVHKGIDLACPMGDTVRTMFDGKVRLTKYERGGFGFYVIVRHENGLETVYGHLSKFLVQPNQYVKAGTPIALSGSTGRSTGPHLHLETRFMGYAINPAAIFDFENRVAHTDTYTFNKSNYSESRSYSPSATYASVKKHAKKNGRQTRQGRSKRSTYKVRSGDNLSTIAAKNGTTVANLRRLNGITGNKIKSGKVIKVK
ncbi:MAG: peptidoglycan DD-metalloendopeptidase family protein [Muribaculaceae bacterium]|nr:peptidoglycan DD-metalloendopeptidase family protein [Muribaculaceae bacterium]